MTGTLEKVGSVASILGLLATVLLPLIGQRSPYLWVPIASLTVLSVAGTTVAYFVRKIREPNGTDQNERNPLHVAFDAEPTAAGAAEWTKAGGGEPPRIAVQTSGHHGRFWLVSSDRGSAALDKTVGPAWSAVRRIVIQVRPEAESHMYVKLRLESKTGSASQVEWLKVDYRRGRPRRCGPELPKETAYPVIGRRLADEWLEVTVDIGLAEREVFEKEGWYVSEVLGFRLRGSMSIASIEGY